MAIKNNRNWIGSEISKEYCSIIEQRIRNVKPSLFNIADNGLTGV